MGEDFMSLKKTNYCHNNNNNKTCYNKYILIDVISTVLNKQSIHNYGTTKYEDWKLPMFKDIKQLLFDTY